MGVRFPTACGRGRGRRICRRWACKSSAGARAQPKPGAEEGYKEKAGKLSIELSAVVLSPLVDEGDHTGSKWGNAKLCKMTI
mmetsp:Transcript_25176/g.63356  ORF Transcript_25176/g.63356 Transcript_25176/m.63356 type:complete len:82 (-) Transcript_25176:460-705(-)